MVRACRRELIGVHAMWSFTALTIPFDIFWCTPLHSIQQSWCSMECCERLTTELSIVILLCVSYLRKFTDQDKSSTKTIQRHKKRILNTCLTLRMAASCRSFAWEAQMGHPNDWKRSPCWKGAGANWCSLFNFRNGTKVSSYGVSMFFQIFHQVFMAYAQ